MPRKQSRSRRSFIKLGATALGVTGLVGTAATTAGAHPSPTHVFNVSAVGTQFVPEVLTVPEGATVTWEVAAPAILHSVTSAATTQDAINGEHNTEGDWVFDQWLTPGDTVQAIFSEPGRYPYFCKPHVELGMVGEIEVV